MHLDNINKLNGYGVIWRVVQPLIIATLGAMILLNLSQFKEILYNRCANIEKEINGLRGDFKEHVAWGLDLAEKRGDRLREVERKVSVIR
jgi:hypothetical protein